MTAKRCWSCGTTFYSDYGAVKCNVCQQTEALTRLSNQQAADARRQATLDAQAAARQAQALINAENARIDAINTQTQVIMESSIKPADAYKRGYSYPDTELRGSNPAELTVIFLETGNLSWEWHHLYITPILQQEFARGLSNRFDKIPNQFALLKSCAFEAGKGNANGTTKSPFTLTPGPQLGGVKIRTKAFDSKFSSVLNEKTGEIVMKWNAPFSNTELNNQYEAGIKQVSSELNKPDKMNYRLRFEVPELKAERAHLRFINRLDAVYRLLFIIAPIYACYLILAYATPGIALMMLISVPFVWKFFKRKYRTWSANNNLS